MLEADIERVGDRNEPDAWRRLTGDPVGNSDDGADSEP